MNKADDVVQMLRAMLSERLGDSITHDNYCAECGAAQSHCMESLWVERYAELLGCEPRPAAVSLAIAELSNSLHLCRRSISEHRKRAYLLGLNQGKKS
jgi:hypothetical protein